MIAIGCDHGGFALKQDIMAWLDEHGYTYKDFGTHNEESCDYPIYGEAVARSVASGECELGLLFCGTGIGISLAANRVPGIRAAVCSEAYSAQLTREHNNANIICFGGRVVGEGTAFMIVDAFLNAEFQGGRHAERVAMLDNIK